MDDKLTPKPITDPQSQSSYDLANSNIHTVENNPIEVSDDNKRALARNTTSGVSRGIQLLGGPSLVADSGAKQIRVNDDINRVLMGNQSTFGEGFYVSKSGIDVLTAVSASDFIFNSNQNVFKIVGTGSGSVTSPVISKATVGYIQSTVQTTVPLPPGLLITPASIGFVQYGTTFFNTPYHYAPNSSGSYVQHDTVSVFTNGTNVIIQVLTELSVFVAGAVSTGALTYPVKYYLLQETAN